MIFLGDLACPEQKIDDFIKCVNDILEFENEIIVINLEANIVDNNEERKELTLYNLSKITDAFKKSNRVIVSLANNHMYDYPEKILETKSILEKLTYPDCSKQTYGIRFRENKVDRIWFDTDKGKTPIRVAKIDEDIVYNHEFPDCIDMDERVYKDFFKRNRAKKFLVPVFTQIGGVKMAYQEAWAITRVKVLRKVKGWMRK